MKKGLILFLFLFSLLAIIFLARNFSFWDDSWLIYYELKNNFTDNTGEIPNNTDVETPYRASLQNTNQQNISNQNTPAENTNNNINNPVPTNTNTNIDTTNSSDNPSVLPRQINNPAPFIVQAPLGNWDQLHEEACEETSLLIAHYFLEKRKIILSKEAEEAIQKLSSYTKNVFPKKDDLTIEELKNVAEKYFNHQGWKIIDNPDDQIIKRELSLGNIIIAPMAGRELGNPFYKTPGPLYHMLIISGYNEDKKVFITQDPGTKRGQDFEYSFEKINFSLHDFPGQKEKIEEGKKRILVIFAQK